MQDLPHHYQVSAQSGPEGDVGLDTAGVPTLPSAAPVEFGGPPGSTRTSAGGSGGGSPEPLPDPCGLPQVEAPARLIRLSTIELQGVFSNLAGATSSLIVPSNHSAPRNPQAIAEVKRILHLHH